MNNEDNLIFKIGTGVVIVTILVYIGISLIDELRARYWVSEIQKGMNSVTSTIDNAGNGILNTRITSLERENQRLRDQLREMESIRDENRRLQTKYEFLIEREKPKSSIQWSE